MRITQHPLWQVGFRPFFALACLSGLSLPLLWAAIYSGRISFPAGDFQAVQWHAHEMFFGFGWAVLGGFLLTATKNWVNIRGYHGGALMFLVAAWLFERCGMWFGGEWPPLLFRLSNNLFLLSIVAMLLWTLIRYRKQDAFKDNYLFLLILPLFLLSKNLMLSTEYMLIGWSMALGLFRMAFLVMLERTQTPFMQGAFQVAILRNPVLDNSIKLLGLLLVFESLMPAALSGWLALLLAALLAGRFVFWKPHLAFQRLDIGIMYLGYLAIVIQLVIYFANQIAPLHWVGSLSMHLFTFGAMGLIIPAMLMRISKGHTGRKVVFDRIDRFVLHVMLLGLLVRVVLPQLYPDSYVQWIYLAAACWLLCFGVLAWRYIPILLKPRL
ncbi:MAG: NnrS family protein [Gallionella sp.]|nr:NnrS family protein [Gallionella sp.]